jgi:hypothetical protein
VGLTPEIEFAMEKKKAQKFNCVKNDFLSRKDIVYTRHGQRPALEAP